MEYSKKDILYNKTDILVILERVIEAYDDKFNLEHNLATAGIYTDEITNGFDQIIDAILFITEDTKQADAIYDVIGKDLTARERAEKVYEMRWEDGRLKN